jgi:hypothetical protein
MTEYECDGYEYDCCEASDDFGTSGFGGPTEESDNFGSNSVLRVEPSPSLPANKTVEPIPSSQTTQSRLEILPFHLPSSILRYLINSKLFG